MSSFEQSPPSLSLSALANLADTGFGVRGEVSLLNSERDQNARIKTPNGSFVLKVINSAESRDFVDLQNAALAHLEAVGVVGIPKLVRTPDGTSTIDHSSNGQTSMVRLVTFIEGKTLSQVAKSEALLFNLGEFIGSISLGLQGFGHPAAHRPDFIWNLDNPLGCADYVADIAHPGRRALVERLFAHYRRVIAPKLVGLRSSVLHQDANDNNVIVDVANPERPTGLIDFGDMGFGHTINELAITLAYALMDSPNIYPATRALVSGYTTAFPLQSNEIDVLFDLVKMRLVMSVCISSHQSKKHPDNAYLLISQEPAFALLERLDALNPAFLAALCREAAGFAATASHGAVSAWLSEGAKPAPMFTPDLQGRSRMVLHSGQPGAPAFSDRAFDRWFDEKKQGDRRFFGIGLYGEVRSVYATDAFADAAGPERRTRHMGVDIFVDAQEPLHAPLAGRVFAIANNAMPLDYGHTLILEHRTVDDVPFYTLYGHLGASLPTLLTAGQDVAAGQLIGHIGDWSENGGWAPHLHFQIITDLLGQTTNFYGVGHDSLWPVWSQISLDPNLLLQLAPESFVTDPQTPERLLQRRSEHIGRSLSISYAQKLKIVRGKGAYLFDHTGRRFLDGVNNITHIGHAHPRIVEAITRQAAILNTNTRYLSELMLDYAERLTAKLPAPLSVAYFVNSGTEANELALRIARTANQQKHTIVLDWAYHGNSGGMVDVSPYKFKRKGGYPQPDFVEIAAFPDPYRGPHQGYGAASGQAYAQDVGRAVAAIKAKTGNGRTAFIAESISGVGGQVIYPDRYLQHAYAAVRAEGGVCIADEVQCGFGRVGEAFWGFELQGVVPDIVVMGKPIGNGHPLAAVVTTPQLAAAFANGMEYFNSFGGNPVSMAVGLAVLDVIEGEGLQQQALETGAYMLERFNDLKDQFPIIGDVRGRGLFSGIELVRDRDTLEPATAEATAAVNHMRQHGVLASTDGPLDNVLKFKPPMVFGRVEADTLCTAITAALSM